MDRDAEAASLKLNDSEKPGRVYLCGKGNAKYSAETLPEVRNLARMRAALDRRNPRNDR